MDCILTSSLRRLLPSCIFFIHKDSPSTGASQEEQSTEGKDTEEVVNPNVIYRQPKFHGSVYYPKYILPDILSVFSRY